MNRSRARAAVSTAGLVLLVLVVLGAAGVGGYLVTGHLRARPTAAPTRPAPAAPAAIASATDAPPAVSPGRPGAPAGARAVGRALARLVRAPGLGGLVHSDVVDAATGARLYATGARVPVPPASTAKLLVAAAVLTVHPPTYRIATTVRAAAHGTLVLVGGGDPTLSGAPAHRPGAYPGAARLSDLAAQLRGRHRPVRRIVVDDALFSGPSVSPAWAPEDVPSSYASAITPVLTDGGRAAPGDEIRSATPDLDAGHELAALLRRPGLPVTVTHAAAGGPVVATVRSAPLSTLVAQMLQDSDNVIAECLARQVALARDLPASFLGAASAVRDVIRSLRVRQPPGMLDGSGLAAADRLPTSTTAAVLRAVLARPALHPVLAGLPVAGWSGTLADRYLTGRARAGAGVVRAKTGTLTGVSALAGVVHDASGRLLVFALDADHAGSTEAADAALDLIAARLARCGCG